MYWKYKEQNVATLIWSGWNCNFWKLLLMKLFIRPKLEHSIGKSWEIIRKSWKIMEIYQKMTWVSIFDGSSQNGKLQKLRTHVRIALLVDWTVDFAILELYNFRVRAMFNPVFDLLSCRSRLTIQHATLKYGSSRCHPRVFCKKRKS